MEEIKAKTREEKIEEIRKVVTDHAKETGRALGWCEFSKRNFIIYNAGVMGVGYLECFTSGGMLCKKVYKGEDLGVMNVEYEEVHDRIINRIYSAIMRKKKSKK